MASISGIVGLMSCGFLLCLGLSNPAQADNAVQAVHPPLPGDPALRKGQVRVSGERDKLKGGHRIEGKVLRAEGRHYFIMGQDGQEVRLQSDQNTRKTGSIVQGDRVVAFVNDQNHVRSIRLADMADMSDRGNEKTDRTADPKTVSTGQ